MERPNINQYQEPSKFVKDMIAFRKATERNFSVLRATKNLRKLSPTLVSLVMTGQRKLTVDRVEGFSRLLNLNKTEKTYFRTWVGQLEGQEILEGQAPNEGSRKEVSTGLLSDWINVYVKDFFQIPAVQRDPSLIEKQLMPVAPSKRVAKAVAFLLREGYLRKTVDGKTVLDTRLAIAEPHVPSQKIRQFHKGALTLAKLALDLFSPQERLANTLIVPIDEKRYHELLELIQEFSDRLKDFAARNPENGTRLYQLIVNLSPIGGKLE